LEISDEALPKGQTFHGCQLDTLFIMGLLQGRIQEETTSRLVNCQFYFSVARADHDDSSIRFGDERIKICSTPFTSQSECHHSLVQAAEYADERMVSSVSSSSTGYLTVLLMESRFKKNSRRCHVPDNDPGVFQPIADTHRVLKPL